MTPAILARSTRMGLAFEFEFDFVVRNVAHHAFGVVEALAVFFEHGNHVVCEVLASHFVPLSGERAVQLTEADHGNLRDWQCERFAARGFRRGESERRL